MQNLRFILQRIGKDIRKNKIPLFIILIYMAVTRLLFHTVCPFAIMFGFPCPACGLTRAGLLLCTGRLAEAALSNAAIFLWAPFLLYLLIFRYVLGKNPPRGLLIASLVCALTILYYVLRLLQGNPVSVPYEGLLFFLQALSPGAIIKSSCTII